jgi:hypothetical protein
MRNINPRNAKHRTHGYQKWYSSTGVLWYKGYYKNGSEIGYNESNMLGNSSIGDFGTRVNFYIK